MLWVIFAIIVLIIAYIILKPYFIKYNSTICLTGEMGAGKTYIGVNNITIKAYKGRLWRVKIHNWVTKQLNKIIKHHNKKVVRKAVKPKYKGKTWHEKEYQPLPRILSNIPIRIKGGKHPIWSNVLEKEMLTFEKLQNELIKLPEGSVLFIDELPQLVDQFNWDLEKVQNNLNEFITFIRHYFSGLLVITAQSIDQVVKPIRQKMNTFYYLSNFRKFLFFFYKVDIIQFMSTEIVQNISEGFVEDNMKTTYGILHKHRYDSRCYSARYEQIPENEKYKFKVWHQYKTKRIIRFDDYESPLDPPKKATTNE